MTLYNDEHFLPESLYPLIGKNIRRIRRQHGITQEHLAELIGVDQKQISHIESGKARAKLSIYLRIADAFGVSIDSFLIDALPLYTEWPSTLNMGEKEERLLNEIVYIVTRYLEDKET